jgi:3-isopropylmalate/(R)-2-methylmalate dehydratase small subunit
MIANPHGRAWVYGDRIDTDLLAPGAYMKLPIDELASHCLEAIDPHFAAGVRPGDFVVAGHGFGIGSSREQAAEALLHFKIAAVVAKSFARIFYRNAINLGLPLIICNLQNSITKGDQLIVDAASGRIENISRNMILQGEPLPEFLLAIINAGGLMSQLERECRPGATA